jgi:sugar-specific transcriptional regulator TrmB
MDEQNLVAHVEQLGLSNKEAKVYLASLSLGPAPVQQIADEAHIKRVTTYVVLESLAGLGLVNQTLKGKKTLYMAEEPATLSRLLERRANDLADQETNLKTIMPRLSALRLAPQVLPQIRFYDGPEAVRGLLTDFYSLYKGSAEEGLIFSNVDELRSFMPERGESQADPERLKRGIHSRLIYTSKQGAIYRLKEDELARVSRYVPFEKYPVTGYIGVLGEYVVMIGLSARHPVGLTMKNPQMAQSMRAMFELSWDYAGTLE